MTTTSATATVLFGFVLLLINVASTLSADEEPHQVLFRTKRHFGAANYRNSQYSPVGNSQWGNYGQQQQTYPQRYQQSSYQYGQNQMGGTNGYSYNQGVDLNNFGGTHYTNVGIGGIQNFRGGNNGQFQQLLGDATNNGGSHQTNAGIGGILNF